MTSSPAAAGRLILGGRPLGLISPARLYVCGITPYDVTHLGHAATFVWADTASRIMRLTGAKVVVCRNVTDVDDALTLSAAEKGRVPDELAVVQEHQFEQDIAALRVELPTFSPRARAYVDQVIQLAAALLDSEHAYQRDGQVYFRGFPAISGGGPASAAEHGELIDTAPGAEAYDVAVWRRSETGEPAWPSPWGPGRPGWHAECAAIALSVLGASIDVVAGGADLSYPHQAYQAALVEAATGARPFARARLAVGTVKINGEKMAKSEGNLVLVSDLLRKHTPAAIRLMLLDRPWHDCWDFCLNELHTAAARLECLYSVAGRSSEPVGAVDAVKAALLRELDVPTALDIAEEAGGEAARLALNTLSLF